MLWNLHCWQKVNAVPLEELIEKYELIVNNNTDFLTRPSSSGISIINLALTSPDLGPLQVWEIPEEYPSLSDHELILLKWEDLDSTDQNNSPVAVIGWNIRNLVEDDKLLRTAQIDWKSLGDNHLR